MTHPTPAPGDLLAEFNGWRLERKDAKQRPIWFLFRVVSADGLLQYKGAFDGARFGSGRDMAHLRRSEPSVFVWVAKELRRLWDEGGLM